MVYRAGARLCDDRIALVCESRDLSRDDRRNSRHSHIVTRITYPGKISELGIGERRDVGLWGNTGYG